MSSVDSSTSSSYFASGLFLPEEDGSAKGNGGGVLDGVDLTEFMQDPYTEIEFKSHSALNGYDPVEFSAALTQARITSSSSDDEDSLQSHEVSESLLC